ncbi:hypothetical protein D3C84_1184890 [compost metagenome]
MPSFTCDDEQPAAAIDGDAVDGEIVVEGTASHRLSGACIHDMGTAVCPARRQPGVILAEGDPSHLAPRRERQLP